MWQDPIGSMRHLRGTACPSITVTIAMDWANVTTEHTTIVSKTFEAKNATFVYVPATWQRINEVEAMVTHR